MKAIIYLSIGLLLIIYASSTSSPPRSPLAVTSSKIMSSTDEADTKNNDAERDHQEHNITRYITMKFEVFGRVQGVFFRKYTKAKAEELGLTGWCRNTPRGTVQGEFEYALFSAETGTDNGNNTDEESWEAIAFQHWLCRTGSPKSRIDRCTFSEKLTSSSSSAKTRKYDAFRVIR
jgi:acylphosphatase